MNKKFIVKPFYPNASECLFNTLETAKAFQMYRDDITIMSRSGVAARFMNIAEYPVYDDLNKAFYDYDLDASDLLQDDHLYIANITSRYYITKQNIHNLDDPSMDKQKMNKFEKKHVDSIYNIIKNTTKPKLILIPHGKPSSQHPACYVSFRINLDELKSIRNVPRKRRNNYYMSSLINRINNKIHWFIMSWEVHPYYVKNDVPESVLHTFGFSKVLCNNDLTVYEHVFDDMN